MRNFVVAACLVLGACAFEPGVEPDEMGSGAGSGMGSGSGSGSPIVNTALPCSFTDPSLRLCLEFEDQKFDPMVTDSSSMRLDAGASDIGQTTRAGKAAAALAWTSKIQVPESAALDITGPLTIEMWLWPALAQPVSLVQNVGQFRLQVTGDRRIGCALGNSQVYSDSDAVHGEDWTHVACRFDGTTLAVFIDGKLQNSAPGASAPTTGTMGTVIGGHFVGMVDDLRIFATALPNATLCAHTGRTSCDD